MIDPTETHFEWACAVTEEDSIDVRISLLKKIIIHIDLDDADETPSVVLTADDADELAQALTLLAARLRQ